MNAIVAVDKNWAIGNKGQLLVSIPNDQKMFREETTGKVIVLGRKTLETFPGKRPLKNRTNIILTTDKNYVCEGAVVVHSLEELFEELKNYNDDDIYIIGGDSVYRQLVDYCSVCHVTMIDKVYESDAYFPDLSKNPSWKMELETEEMTYFDLEYTFQKWVKIN